MAALTHVDSKAHPRGELAPDVVFTMVATASNARSFVDEFSGLGSATLLVAGPALSLVRQWEAELTVLRRRSPTSDAATTLTTCLRELIDAIKVARDTRLHLTIADVHATSRIPVSTLRWLCQHKAELLGAEKHKGVWYIDRGKLERYMATSDRDVPIGSGKERRVGKAAEAA